jgi:hypothetical protein
MADGVYEPGGADSTASTYAALVAAMLVGMRTFLGVL